MKLGQHQHHPQPPRKRKPGRPKGSRNKPKAPIESTDGPKVHWPKADGVPIDGRCKLSHEQVKAVQALYAGGVGPTELGRRFGVSRQAIHNIVKGNSWSKIEVRGGQFVYLLRGYGSDHYKIGYSADVPARIKRLQPLMPWTLGLVGCFWSRNALADEQELLARHAKHCTYGEWFLFAPEYALMVQESFPHHSPEAAMRAKFGNDWRGTKKSKKNKDYWYMRDIPPPIIPD